MKILGIQCSPITNRIFAGSLSKDKTMFLSDKQDVTNICINSVLNYIWKSTSRKNGDAYEFGIGDEIFQIKKIK